jgi:hypothetical protein
MSSATYVSTPPTRVHGVHKYLHLITFGYVTILASYVGLSGSNLGLKVGSLGGGGIHGLPHFHRIVDRATLTVMVCACVCARARARMHIFFVFQ